MEMRIRNHAIFRNKEIKHTFLNVKAEQRNMICDSFCPATADIKKNSAK